MSASTTTIYTLARLAGTDARTLVEQIRAGQTVGDVMWRRLDRDDRRAAADLGLNGWPECVCAGCGCSEPATTTDDGGYPVCENFF